MSEGPAAARDLRRRSAAAVGDAPRRANLAAATDDLAGRRRRALDELTDAGGLRDAARAVRARGLRELPERLERLADRLLARGAHVHWARDAADANATVVSLARARGARRVVKSKSMLSEEIGLNAALERAGCTVTETDLGEWIVQLAGETPSHIIVPAVHRNRREIAEVLARVAGGDLSDEPEALAAFARERLRARFLEADLGVSGVNFAVAETGGLVLVTNEGNGRAVTGVPPVHVALLGMERVVASWDELDLLLALLPRSATGQPLTAYTSLIHGPRRPGEVDGPEELHVVIVDNGRGDLLGGEFEEMLACIRCGACLNACPVYRQIGGHAYASTYPGPMGAVLAPLLSATPGDRELPQASSLCGACWQACPVGIPLHDLLLGLRRREAEGAPAGGRMAWRAWSAVWRRPRLYRASLRLLRVGRALVDAAGRLPPPLDRWTDVREAPEFPRRDLRRRLRRGRR